MQKSDQGQILRFWLSSAGMFSVVEHINFGLSVLQNVAAILYPLGVTVSQFGGCF